MDNSIYITLSRQLALFRDMEATTNNIANANTTGYSSEHIMFKSYLSKDINQGTPNKMSFAYDIASYRNTDNGSVRATENPLDVAINGNGYFVVQTPLGTRYTRSGNFQLLADGTLATPEGYTVMDNSNQSIVFPEDTNSVDIGEAGNIKVNGEDFGILNVVQFENEQLLERVGSTLYQTDATPIAADPATARVAQGVLENSNVQPVMELTHMITISRAVANTAKFIEVVYDLQRKASNTWAQQA